MTRLAFHLPEKIAVFPFPDFNVEIFPILSARRVSSLVILNSLKLVSLLEKLSNNIKSQPEDVSDTCSYSQSLVSVQLRSVRCKKFGVPRMPIDNVIFILDTSKQCRAK